MRTKFHSTALQCFGGKLGALHNTPEGKEALKSIGELDMESVRKVIKLLISQGLDSKKPERATHQQCLIAYEATAELVPIIQETALVFKASTKRMLEETKACSDLCKSVSSALVPVARLADTIEGLNVKQDEEGSSNEVSTLEFKQVLEANKDSEALERFMDFEIDPLLLPLYEELDAILIQQEVAKFGSRYMKEVLSKEFNKCLMNLYKVEEMWRCLTEEAGRIGKTVSISNNRHRFLLNLRQLGQILEALGFHVTEEETRQIFREASVNIAGSFSGKITPENLLVQSNTFQNCLLENLDDDIAQLLFRSKALRVMSWAECLQFLCPLARQVQMRAGQELNMRVCCILAVQTGHVTVTYRDESSTHHREVRAGDVVGEVNTMFLFPCCRVSSMEQHRPDACTNAFPHGAPSSLLMVPPLLIADDECESQRERQIPHAIWF